MVGSPVKSNDYHAWGVEHPEYFVNSYVLYVLPLLCSEITSCLPSSSQDWFTITGRGTDDTGNWIELDHDLRFDVYATRYARPTFSLSLLNFVQYLRRFRRDGRYGILLIVLHVS